MFAGSSTRHRRGMRHYFGILTVAAACLYALSLEARAQPLPSAAPPINIAIGTVFCLPADVAPANAVCRPHPTSMEFWLGYWLYSETGNAGRMTTVTRFFVSSEGERRYRSVRFDERGQTVLDCDGRFAVFVTSNSTQSIGPTADDVKVMEAAARALPPGVVPAGLVPAGTLSSRASIGEVSSGAVWHERSGPTSCTDLPSLVYFSTQGDGLMRIGNNPGLLEVLARRHTLPGESLAHANCSGPVAQDCIAALGEDAEVAFVRGDVPLTEVYRIAALLGRADLAQPLDRILDYRLFASAVEADELLSPAGATIAPQCMPEFNRLVVAKNSERAFLIMFDAGCPAALVAEVRPGDLSLNFSPFLVSTRLAGEAAAITD